MQDRQILCELYFEFHELHVAGVPDRLVSRGEPPDTYEHSELCATLGQIISNADAAIFVAESGGQLVGLAEVYLRQDEANPLRVAHRYGLLQSLMVKDTFRHQGIGSRLLQAAQRWAQERDAVEMWLDTWEFEAGPLPFYEKCGYRTLRRTLVRAL